MSILMTRLEKLNDFSSRLETQTKLIQEAERTPTTTVADLRGLIQARSKTEDEFNQWMMSEFKFAEGPQTLPQILKRVLETSVEPNKIIMP